MYIQVLYKLRGGGGYSISSFNKGVIKEYDKSESVS